MIFGPTMWGLEDLPLPLLTESYLATITLIPSSNRFGSLVVSQSLKFSVGCILKIGSVQGIFSERKT